MNWYNDREKRQWNEYNKLELNRHLILFLSYVCVIVITHDQGLGLQSKGRTSVESSIGSSVGDERESVALLDDDTAEPCSIEKLIT